MAEAAVVIPTFNERENIEAMLRALLAVHSGLEVLVVDDQSPDGTGARVAELARECPRIVLIANPVRAGFGPSLAIGFAEAFRRGCTKVLQMDADFSHPVAVVPRLLEGLEDADLVIGSRYVEGGSTPGWPRRRRLLSRGGGFYTRLILGVPCRDVTAGFKAWRADLLRRIEPHTIVSGGYGFQIESVYRAHRLGARIREIPIEFVDRRAGTSKMSGKIILEALLNVPRLRLRRWAPGSGEVTSAGAR